MSGDCTEDQQPREAPREFSSWWLFIYHNSRNSKVHSHPARRVVACINILCISEIRRFLDHFDKLKLLCNRAAECLAHPCSCLFFLDLWRDPSGFCYFVLYGFLYGCTILCGLVLVCDSTIDWRSSRSPQGFGVSLPVAWSHPTLAGIKLFIHCSKQSYPYSWTYCREDRVILVLEYIGTYHVVSELSLLR
jgi:hypothetical protein